MLRVTLVGIIASGLGILLLAAAYYFPGSSYWAALLLELGSLGLGLGLGVLVVNYYFELDAQRMGARAVMRFLAPTIAEHHNMLLDAAYSVFCGEHFKRLVYLYLSHDGDPRAPPPDQRKRFYDLVKARKDDFWPLLRQIDADMRELTSVLTWTFHAGILRDAYGCRYSIAKLLKAEFDDSDQTALAVCEHLLDVDFMSGRILQVAGSVRNR